MLLIFFLMNNEVYRSNDKRCHFWILYHIVFNFILLYFITNFTYMYFGRKNTAGILMIFFKLSWVINLKINWNIFRYECFMKLYQYPVIHYEKQTGWPIRWLNTSMLITNWLSGEKKQWNRGRKKFQMVTGAYFSPRELVHYPL